MTVEIWINTLQYEYSDNGHARRLIPPEVHQRFLNRRASCLAFELGNPEDEHRIESVITASPSLAAALEPRVLDNHRVGIVLEDHILAALRVALTP